MRRPDPSSTPLRISVAMSVVASVLIAGVSDVSAIKWSSPKSCPNYSPKGRKLEKKLFKMGNSGLLTEALFVHVGREMALFQKATKTGLPKGGGFSTEPGGNVVEIAMLPPEGDPIPLPPFAVTAVSPTALYFPFPDSREFIGRLVVGRMTMTIHTPTTTYGPTKSKTVVLPPANDVGALVEEGAELEVLGAVSGTHLWIPLQFSSFGEAPPMPTCPTPLTPKTAMSVGLSMRGKDGSSIPYATLTSLRRADLFLGDFILDGVNWYGLKLRSTSLEVPGLRRGRVLLCAMNDTMDVVMMLSLSKQATGRESRLTPLIRDGSPLRIKLEDISADPNPGGRVPRQDSFGLSCLPQ